MPVLSFRSDTMYVIDYDGGNMWKLTFPSNGAQGLPSTTSALGPMIKVFPNPATDQISLEARMDNVLINSALILNGQGQELGDLINSGNETYTADIEQLPVGVYYIQVKTNRGTVLKKFVK